MAEVPAEKIKLYEKLVASNPNVERKGKSTPYTSLNGHMFSFITTEHQMALRLSAGDREAFLEKYQSAICEQHGRVMKEYVLIPDSLLKKTAELKKHFDRSFAYVGSLKPKPTTRPKKNGAKKKAAKVRPVKKQAAKKKTVKKKTKIRPAKRKRKD